MRTKHNYARYVWGCHCFECCEASRLYRAELRARQRELPTPDHVHGTVNGYGNYACRCVRCSEAQATATRNYRLRKAAS